MGIPFIFRSSFWRVALVLLMLLALAGAPQHASAASSCTVAASGAMYRTIQAAVDDSSCSTIDVAAGIYTENVTIRRDVMINGASQDTTIVDGNNADSVFLTDSTSVTLANLTIQHGKSEWGGGVRNLDTLTLKNSTLRSNTATNGGGIFIYYRGALTVQNSVIDSNTATNYGGGMLNQGTLTVQNSTVRSNSRGNGGGISQNGGPLTVTNSAFSGNSATYGGGIDHHRGPLTVTSSTFSNNRADTFGGGIIVWSLDTTSITNSTFSGNTAGEGGGIRNVGGNVAVTNSTFSGNTTFSPNGGGSINNSTGSLTLINSILANSPNGDDCLWELAHASRNNLVEGAKLCGLTDGVNGNIVGLDPQIGPLHNNGGPTETHALLAGSPALDRASAADCPSTDQRGEARPQGAGCDIGAYEFKMTYAWSGFKKPIDKLPTVNSAKAGSGVPVKFSLGGNYGLNIFAAGSPASQKIACDSAAPLDEIEQTAAAGASGLQYDAASDTYSYVWKTDKAWAGSCRQLAVALADGTVHTAAFKFK